MTRWHGQVLKEIANTICSTRDQCKCLQPARQAIAFIRAAEKPKW